MITDDTLQGVEKALDITLYDWQKAFIKGEPCEIPGGRRSGYTLAYCTKVALSEGMPILVPELPLYADGNHGDHYAKQWFPRYFLEIWHTLRDAGLPVRQMVKERKFL